MILLSNGIGLILNGSSTHKCINKLKYIRETGRLNQRTQKKQNGRHIIQAIKIFMMQ